MNQKRLHLRAIARLLLISLTLSSAFSGFPLAQAQEAPPAPAPRAEEQMSVIALCDPDGGEAPTAGYGWKVETWPPYNTPEYQKSFEAFVKERAASTIDNPSVNGIHKAYPGNQIGRPDLSPALNARKRFFEITFGYSQQGIGAVVQICETKRQLAKRLEQYADQKKKSDSEPNSCEGAFQETKKIFGETEKSYRHYAQIIKHFLNGYSGKLDGRDVRIPSLETEFWEKRRINQANIELYSGQATQERPLKIPQDRQASLKAEFEILWGKTAPQSSGNPRKIESAGTYSDVLLQTRRERKKAEEQANFFKKEKEEMEARERRCRGDASLAPAVAPVAPASTVTGGSRPPARPGTAPASDLEDRTGDQPPRDPQQRVRDTTRGDDPSPEEREPPPPGPRRANRPPADEPAPEEREPPPPRPVNNKDEGGGAMGFLKENWPWLVGGGVLIGGGVWLWNRNKKQEKEKKYWQDDLNFAKSPNNSGSTTSGGSGGTLSANQLPSGARLIFGTSVSGASVGQNLNAIYVIVVDANGTVQNVNGIAVTASCLAPNPCSLDGAKVVTTANGYAIFSGLKFNQPDRGVILQFSAPALPSLTSPGQFDVQGSSGRQ